MDKPSCYNCAIMLPCRLRYSVDNDLAEVDFMVERNGSTFAVTAAVFGAIAEHCTYYRIELAAATLRGTVDK